MEPVLLAALLSLPTLAAVADQAGPLTQEGRSFRLGSLAATRMACPQVQAEHRFLGL